MLRRLLFTATVLLCLLFFIRTVDSYVRSNFGLLRLLNLAQKPNASYTHSLDRLKTLFEKAITLYPNNRGARHGLGFVRWYAGSDAQALDEWQQIDLEAHDYVLFGQYADNVSESLRWYSLAERVDPANSELWLHVGQICQRDPSVGNVCERFLTHNDYNWLVDPEFDFDRAAWHFNRLEGAMYAIESCPGITSRKCAFVEINEITSTHGTGWQQCLALEPGLRYSFSAWIMVETAGQWIPIYYQGSVDGKPDGHRLGGMQIGTQDWTYWEQTFTAPVFDEDRACFHPARLLDVGQLWFHSAALRVVE